MCANKWVRVSGGVMSQPKICLGIALFALALFIDGCGPSSARESTVTPQPGMVLTSAAQTAEARLTELAQPTSTPQPTPTYTFLPPPTQIPTPTISPPLTLTLVSTPMPTIVGTALTGGADQAQFWADISVPDGSDFSPGQSFTKTWRLKNVGQTTWTEEYALVFIGGAQMGGTPAVPLATRVPPGQTVDVSVNLVAPQETGTYRGYWEMRNAAGELFQQAVYVEIDVIGGTPQAVSTAPSASGGRVTNVALEIDNPSPEECPYTFLLTATFTLNAPATVTYQLEAGSDTPGFEFTLPSPQTSAYAAGTHVVTFDLNITSSVSGWAQFHIQSPNDLLSNRVNFSLRCKP